MKQIRNDSEIDNQYSKMASIKTAYEAGIQSKVDIAKKHGISPVTLWRHAQKGNWSYGKMREDVLESMSEEALKRLGKLTGSIIEEHVMLLSGLRQQILTATDTSEIKRMSTQVDALVKCIKGERTALGLPNHIVGMSTEGGEVIL